MPKKQKEVNVLAVENLSDFAYKLVEAVSYLAIAGIGWKVAIWILALIGI